MRSVIGCPPGVEQYPVAVIGIGIIVAQAKHCMSTVIGTIRV